MSIIGNPIMVGGGGKNISSIIITGLTSTDTITCTKDGKTYPATWDDTSQHWEIVGLPLGTFTVTATNGTKTTTETVLIDIAGVYEVEMDFKLWLYRYGDECEDVTGGWVDASTNNGGCFVTSNAIDFDNFTKFYATFMRKRSDTYAYRGQFDVGDTEIISPSADGYNEYITRSADITSITGSKSVRARVRNSNSTVYTATKNSDNLHLYTYQSGYCDAHLYVKEIWLE